MDSIYKRKFDPILKWPGGKGQELKYIHPLLPKNINNYYEPFLGGGAVYFSINSKKYFVNDNSIELINLYRAIKEQDQIFFLTINEIIYNWTLLENIVDKNNLFFTKLYLSFSNDEINEVELQNQIIEFVIKHSKEFNGMLESSFNVNIDNFLKEINKNITKKIEGFQNNDFLSHLKKTKLESIDFELFFDKYEPFEDDFIFLDPPYDSDFSTYAKNTFDKEDQERLASYLVSHCKAKWLMIIKNTDFIFNLYNKSKLNISHFDKKYLVSFQNRNNKNTEHLIIRNYAV